MSDKQPIGYLMGLPIYEVDDMPDPGEMRLGWERCDGCNELNHPNDLSEFNGTRSVHGRFCHACIREMEMED